MFPGLSVEEFLANFSSRVPIAAYLPDPKPAMKVPRSFIFDILRTLATDAFDEYVQSGIAERQKRIVKTTNQEVKMLPIFEEKLRRTQLMSVKNATESSRRQPKEGGGKPRWLLSGSTKPKKRIITRA
jgi:hypothetical protein